ncbi:MAG: hypothetical protein JOY77_01275 [Alphaproteobacteria bacterium]|nr:hypothetical protein [Alphaproteobacteria bacterium]MBV9061543.1 hypothetical protein [Alphaproteobacteria bacterium]
MLKMLAIAAALSGLIATAASAVAPDAASHARPQPLLSPERVEKIVRTQHIRFAGTPYLYNGRYLLRCFDKLGRRSFCEVDPYSGAFLGIALRL